METALTTLQTAHYLGVHRRTIQREIQRGRLKAIHVGRAIRIPADELERYARPAAIAEQPIDGGLSK